MPHIFWADPSAPSFWDSTTLQDWSGHWASVLDYLTDDEEGGDDNDDDANNVAAFASSSSSGDDVTTTNSEKDFRISPMTNATSTSGLAR